MSFSSAIAQTATTRIALIFFGLIQSILLARTLGPEGIGVYSLLWFAVGMAGRFGNLGIGSSLAYFTAKNLITAKQAHSAIFIFVLVCSSITIMPLLIIRSYSISPWHDITPSLFYMMLAIVPLQFAGNFYQRLLSGYLQITHMNLANIAMSFSMLVGVVVFVVWFRMGIWGACIASLTAQLIFLLVQRIPAGNKRHLNNMNESRHSNQIPPMRKIITSFAGYGLWNYFIMLGNFISAELPIYVLKIITGSNWQVGIFSRAQGLGLQALTVVEPIATNLFPFTAKSSEEVAMERTNRTCRLLTLLLGGIALLLCLIIKPLMVLLYGVEFAASGVVFLALAPGIFIRPIGYLTIIHLAASGKHRRALWPNIVAIAFGVIAAWILIPRFQAVGAGLTVSVIITVQAVCSVMEYILQTKSKLRDIILIRRSDLEVLYKVLKGNLKMSAFVSHNHRSDVDSKQNHRGR